MITAILCVAYFAAFVETFRRVAWYMNERRSSITDPAEVMVFAFVVSLCIPIGWAYLAVVSNSKGRKAEIGKPPRAVRKAREAERRQKEQDTARSAVEQLQRDIDRMAKQLG